MAVVKRARKSLEQSMTIITGGSEPVINPDSYRESLLRAINWYNANREEKDFRSYAEYYIKHSPHLKRYASVITKASFLEIKSIGIVGRLVRRDQHVGIDLIAKVLSQLEDIHAKYGQAPAERVMRVTNPAAPSIQDRLNEIARTHCAEVDGQIDQFICEGSADFSMKSYLVSAGVPGAIAKKIGAFYAKQLAVLEEAYAGKDAQLKEGYSNIPRIRLRKLIEFVRQLVQDCTQQVVSAKAQRKPRARKVKSPTVLAAKIKPMKEYPQLKLKSIEPAKIVGADELWVYTPESRKLTVFRGSDGPLSVSGMSVTNYDIERSATKTLRKPEEFFKGLSSYGKRAMANAWKALRAKESKPRGRINDGMILIAAN